MINNIKTVLLVITLSLFVQPSVFAEEKSESQKADQHYIATVTRETLNKAKFIARGIF